MYPSVLLSWPSIQIYTRVQQSFHLLDHPTSLPSVDSSHSLTSLSKMMSSSVIIWGPRRVRQISLPVDISWLKATSACQYLLLVFACTPPGSNTADYWRPLKTVLSCCPHSCYLADGFIVYMQMEVGYWASETIGSNGKQTIRAARGEKVRSIELINTHKGTHYGHRNLYFLWDIHIGLCGNGSNGG